jgi:hypothetical protein
MARPLGPLDQYGGGSAGTRCCSVWQALADHLAGEHVERGEQRGGAVALVVVSHRAGAALLHRQRRLGAVQRLGLVVQRRVHDLRHRLRRQRGLAPAARSHLPQLRQSSSANRARHATTLLGDISSGAAIAVFASPSEASRSAFARITWRWGAVPSLARLSRTSRCPSARVKAAVAGRMPQGYHNLRLFARHYTRRHGSMLKLREAESSLTLRPCAPMTCQRYSLVSTLGG